LLLLGACGGADKTDFKKQTEKFINGTTVAEKFGQKLSDASCEEPTDTSVNTVYHCTATAADGTVVKLLSTITKKDAFELSLDTGADTGTTGDTAVPGGTTPADGSVAVDSTQLDTTPTT
jgi:hypothetical protein